MQTLTNWNTFLKLWAYFTAFDITIFMMISNIYINVYLKYKNKNKNKKKKRKEVKFYGNNKDY